MELRKYFLEQLESEVAASRKALERVPEGRNDWKPRPKSMEMGYLAALVAMMPGWAVFMIDRDGLDLGAPVNEGFKTKAVETRAELLKLLDENATKFRKTLRYTSEEHLMKPWRLTGFGQVMMQGPRYQMLMNGLFSHLAHHRGQLTVYLRLNEAAVPALYGPSADERG